MPTSNNFTIPNFIMFNKYIQHIWKPCYLSFKVPRRKLWPQGRCLLTTTECKSNCYNLLSSSKMWNVLKKLNSGPTKPEFLKLSLSLLHRVFPCWAASGELDSLPGAFCLHFFQSFFKTSTDLFFLVFSNMSKVTQRGLFKPQYLKQFLPIIRIPYFLQSVSNLCLSISVRKKL